MDHYFDGFGRPFKTGVKKITYLTKNEVRITILLKLILYLLQILLNYIYPTFLIIIYLNFKYYLVNLLKNVEVKKYVVKKN